MGGENNTFFERIFQTQLHLLVFQAIDTYVLLHTTVRLEKKCLHELFDAFAQRIVEQRYFGSDAVVIIVVVSVIVVIAGNGRGEM